MAITFDATSQGGENSLGSPLNVTHVCTGSNGLLIVGILIIDVGNADQLTGITYNGTAMTQIAKQNVSNLYWLYSYYLLGPSTGSNTIAISFANTPLYVLSANASYAGVSQSGFPDASASEKSTPATSTTISGTVTTVADNSWVTMVGFAESNTTSSGSGTKRIADATLGRLVIGDSNAAQTPAGGVTLTFNCASDHVGSNTVSFAPVGGGGGATPTPNRGFSLLGVGQ